MNKNFSIIFIAAVLFFGMFSAVGHAQLGDHLLHKGIAHPEVKVLQNLLRSKGYFQYHTSTGYYGPITAQAVREFQRDQGLNIDGIAGPATIEELKLLNQGYTGTSVKNLQEQLKQLGYYDYQVTGIYASITANAVRDFQAAHGLVQDGVAGPATLSALNQYEISEDSESERVYVESTAYTAYCEGCIGITKTGVDLRQYPEAKVIAVDPLHIPLGSTVYVPGYGTALAADIGGAIENQEIDVFIPNESDALEWGRQPVKAQVIN